MAWRRRAHAGPRLRSRSDKRRRHDRRAQAIALAEGTTTIGEVRTRIADLFTDDPARGEIVLSSTHKAKGLEWGTVWMLEDTYRKGKSTEESNLYYVAVTRAIERLVIVSTRAVDEPAQTSAVVSAPPICGAIDAVGYGGTGPVCTESAGHGGDHVAQDEHGRVVSCWADAPSIVDALVSGATIKCWLPRHGEDPAAAWQAVS